MGDDWPCDAMLHTEVKINQRAWCLRLVSNMCAYFHAYVSEVGTRWGKNLGVVFEY